MKIKLMSSPRWLALSCLLLGTAAQAQSPPRGELRYTTHCVACHSTQMHWRQNKLATNRDTLMALVRRWQGVARLDWSEVEVQEVARYLNDTIYRYPEPARVGRLTRNSLEGLPSSQGNAGPFPSFLLISNDFQPPEWHAEDEDEYWRHRRRAYR